VVICIEEVAAEILVTYFYLLLTLHDGLMELGGHYELSALLGDTASLHTIIDLSTPLFTFPYPTPLSNMVGTTR
jgi:hypothetical protein